MPITDWSPCCELEKLQARAKLLSHIRHFFADKGVLEVETPLLAQATGTDPQLDFFSSEYHYPPHNKTLFLQTSPEFSMKRLLAAGSGSIYQICKAFRNGEQGRYHNPEFTLLEWYQVGFSLNQLMDEVGELVLSVLASTITIKGLKKISYEDVFYQVTGLDALNYSPNAYAYYAKNQQIPEVFSLCENDHDLWLDFIFSHKVQPSLNDNFVYLIHSYPASQASLARINPANPKVADRFEVFVNGIELGNGFFELKDEVEQRQRFDMEIALRKEKQRPKVEKDIRFLAALEAGLPDCCGIAMGIDRLLMLSSHVDTLNDVLAFPIDRA